MIQFRACQTHEVAEIPQHLALTALVGGDISMKKSLSFLLIGHLNDVVTCVQLAESYFQIPGRKGFKESLTFRPLNPNQPAANMLLSWLLAALPHVSWRWQQAIDALESEFLSPVR